MTARNRGGGGRSSVQSGQSRARGHGIGKLKAVGLDHGGPNFNALLRLQNHHGHGRPDICE